MRAAYVAQAILITSKRGMQMMYSREEYDAGLLMYALYAMNMDVSSVTTDFLGEDGDW